MNSLLRLAYSAVGASARALARLAPSDGGKVARSLCARRGVVARFERWGREHRDRSRPLLWVHAPSVGEGLQARPLLELARRRRPELQIAYSFFSPSAERFAASLGADFADYLPFDTSDDARHAIAALDPAAIVFAKLDIWPLLCEEAVRHNVPLALVSATVSSASSRRGRVATALLHDAYAALGAIGAVSDEDAARLVSLGARREVIRVTGDTRYDQVWARAAAADLASPLLAPLVATRPTLVAGSTWPADEQVLLPAWETIRRDLPDARLIVAPHEPTEEHLAPIERWAADCDIPIARLGTPAAGEADVVLVDRVGVLGDLYALATAAYVGGGFHDAGLHSVLEPAAFGAPVAFGPRHHKARDAALLLEHDAGAVLRDVHDAEDVLSRWMTDDAAREEGRNARELVERGLGAGERSWEMVEGLLPPRA